MTEKRISWVSVPPLVQPEEMFPEMGFGVEWAAGLFEGEGCILLTSGNSNSGVRYPCAKLEMTDEDVVRRFAGIVQAGNVYGPYKKPGKPTYTWAVAGREAERVIRLLLPYLGERRSQRATEVLSSGV